MTELAPVVLLPDSEVSASKQTIIDYLSSAMEKEFIAISLVGVDLKGNTSSIRHLSKCGDCFKILGALSLEQYIINGILDNASQEDF